MNIKYNGIVMSQEDFYKEISNAIIELEEEKALEFAQKAIDDKMNILEVIEKGFGVAIRRLGELWDEGEYFLPELMMGGIIVKKSIDLLLPHLDKDSDKFQLGVAVVATIEGDVHSIGKTIVATMLSAFGFEVYDLGEEVPPEKIIEAALEKNADIIAVSSLLTTTMVGQKKVIELLKKKGIRDRFKVILGGAPVTKNWADECEADGYAPTAMEAVDLAKSLIGKGE